MIVIGEDFSPWTEKALWALGHHGLSFEFEQYEPLVDELSLRWRTRNLLRKATVPVLLSDGEVIPDSFGIARFAEAKGSAAPLIAGHEREVEEWNARSERALRAGRALLFTRLESNPEALREHVPPFLPERLRPAMTPLVRGAIGYLKVKHGAYGGFTRQARAAFVDELAPLRRRIARAPYVLDGFSYADVAMAVVCQFFAPVEDRYITLRPATRAAWSDDSLAKELEDVVAWRDGLYAKHRR